MDESFRSKLDAKLAGFREWFRLRRFGGCRLVQYCGVELIAAFDISMTDVEPRIEALLCEGFYVGWAVSDGRLYLRVWEFGGPEPTWPKVFAEEHLADVAGVMREASNGA